DVLGIQMSLPVDGHSMLDGTTHERNEKKYYANANLTAVPLSALSASRQPDEIRSRFGPALEREALYRIGPYPELVGKSVEELFVTAKRPVEIELIRSGTFYSLDPQALVPCYI